jgi:hypothetical protein
VSLRDPWGERPLEERPSFKHPSPESLARRAAKATRRMALLAAERRVTRAEAAKRRRRRRKALDIRRKRA